ncbi:MAG: transaldolase [Pseudomonadales bacterium]
MSSAQCWKEAEYSNGRESSQAAITPRTLNALARKPHSAAKTDNPLQRVAALGQSIWLDDVDGNTVESGELGELIARDGLCGLCLNPSTLTRSIADGNDHDKEICARSLVGQSASEIYNVLSIRGAQNAADKFLPLYERTNGKDGYASVELNPHLAHDVSGSIADAHRVWNALDRPNTFIKVPATAAGLAIIEQLISEGINVSVALLFGPQRYRQVLDAYLAGIESRVAQGKSVNRVASVASFSVSPIDAIAEPILENFIEQDSEPADLAEELQGRIAIAIATITYRINQETFASDRFQRLAKKGAHVQRLLWAGCSGSKNPHCNDIQYVDALIGPDTINALAPATLAAYRLHGEPRSRLDKDIGQAYQILQCLPDLGININAMEKQLEEAGIKTCNALYDELLAILDVAVTTDSKLKLSEHERLNCI